MRVLLVEDDPFIGNAVELALRDAAMAVDLVTDGNSAISAAQSAPYNIVLLDLGLPGKDGMEVLAELRRSGLVVPIIVITARDSLDDRIKGLDSGADDYILKPFSIDELLARIRVSVRRSQGAAYPLMHSSELDLDPSTREVAHKGRTIVLSAREYSVLHALMLRPGAILSRDDLEDRIYGWNEEVASNAVEFIIHGLRKKLNKTAIKNVRGCGWKVNK